MLAEVSFRGYTTPNFHVVAFPIVKLLGRVV